jgi:hypothetical protein
VEVLLFLVAPFVVGSLLSAVWPRTPGLLLLGVALAFLFVIAVYLASPTVRRGASAPTVASI